jgi:hypothetical protein
MANVSGNDDELPETDNDENHIFPAPEGGYGGLMFILLLIILLLTVGFWLSTEGHSGYKNSFGSSDLSYSPAAALMSA